MKVVKETIKRYPCWKADSKGNPIEGTDRIIVGTSKRSVVRHLAHESTVDWKQGDLLVRLANGDCWCVGAGY